MIAALARLFERSAAEIARALEAEIPKLRFFDAPHLRDLYENRQYALERSHYDWITRIDSDYVAYTEGPRDVRRLRECVRIPPARSRAPQARRRPGHTGPRGLRLSLSG